MRQTEDELRARRFLGLSDNASMFQAVEAYRQAIQHESYCLDTKTSFFLATSSVKYALSATLALQKLVPRDKVLDVGQIFENVSYDDNYEFQKPTWFGISSLMQSLHDRCKRLPWWGYPIKVILEVPTILILGPLVFVVGFAKGPGTLIRYFMCSQIRYVSENASLLVDDGNIKKLLCSAASFQHIIDLLLSVLFYGAVFFTLVISHLDKVIILPLLVILFVEVISSLIYFYRLIKLRACQEELGLNCLITSIEDGHLTNQLSSLKDKLASLQNKIHEKDGQLKVAEDLAKARKLYMEQYEAQIRALSEVGKS